MKPVASKKSAEIFNLARNVGRPLRLSLCWEIQSFFLYRSIFIKDTRMQVKALTVLFLSLLSCATAFAGVPYGYVGKWRGYHNGKVGLGTCELVAPSWGVTAAHVAAPKKRDPSRKVVVTFGVNKSVQVEKVFIAPSGDFALVKFNKPVTGVTPVKVAGEVIRKSMGTVTFTMVGTSGGRHAHPGRKGHGSGEWKFWHSGTSKTRPGRAGDSGGAFVLDRDGNENDILISVIHGGGRSNQPAWFKNWINNKMKGSGEFMKWRKLPKKVGDPDSLSEVLDSAEKSMELRRSIRWIKNQYIPDLDAAAFSSRTARRALINRLDNLDGRVNQIERENGLREAGFLIYGAIYQCNAQLQSAVDGKGKDDLIADPVERELLALWFDDIEDSLESWL